MPRNISLDTSRLINVPPPLKHHANAVPSDICWVDRGRGWCVQIWNKQTPLCDGTPWDGSLRVAVSHTSAETFRQHIEENPSVQITWDELQAIKDRFWPDQIAIEIYPPRDKIVNVDDLRWLWVLPIGAQLPFHLGGPNLWLRSSETLRLKVKE